MKKSKSYGNKKCFKSIASKSVRSGAFKKAAKKKYK